MLKPKQEQRAAEPAMRSWFSFTAVAAALLCAGIHAWVVLSNIDHPMMYDEAYHILAAEGWQQTGAPTILEGEYTRAQGYTWLISKLHPVCGASLSCLRLASTTASSLMVALVVLFAHRHAGLTAGLIAGAIVALAPPIVLNGHLIRFYSIHALLFFLAAIILFHVPQQRSNVGRGVACVAVLTLILAAIHLQVTTLIGVFALTTAFAAITAPRWLIILVRWPKTVILVLFFAISLGTLLALTVWPGPDLMERLSTGPLWVESESNNPLFYHHALKKWYPGLWILFPFFVLAGAIHHFRITLYSTVIFGITLAVLSIAYTKGDRFIAFVLPFFAVVTGVGGSVALSGLFGSLHGFMHTGMHDKVSLARPIANSLAIAGIGAALMAFLATQPLVLSAARLMIGGNSQSIFGPYANTARWDHAFPTFSKLLQGPAIVMASAGVKAAYFLGDFSFDLGRSVARETTSGQDFGTDTRTGRTVVYKPQSVREIILTCGPGIAIVELYHRNNPYGVPEDTIAELDLLAQRIELPDARLTIWTWDHQQSGEYLSNGTPCRIVAARSRR